MKKITFEVFEDKADGGYVAIAKGCAIATQGETVKEMNDMVRDAVKCHFGDGAAGKAPDAIQLNFV